jgi:hypothetical protein
LVCLINLIRAYPPDPADVAPSADKAVGPESVGSVI